MYDLFVHEFCSHTVLVTTDILLKLFSHSLEIRIWDTKDKVSPRARFDRPKAFRIPVLRGQEDSEGSRGVQEMISSQQKSYENSQPKQSLIIPGKVKIWV